MRLNFVHKCENQLLVASHGSDLAPTKEGCPLEATEKEQQIDCKKGLKSCSHLFLIITPAMISFSSLLWK